MTPPAKLVPSALIADLVRRMAALSRALPALPQRERRIRVVDATMLGPGNRLAVVTFDGRELLLSVTKAGATLLAETRA